MTFPFCNIRAANSAGSEAKDKAATVLTDAFDKHVNDQETL